MRKIYSICFLFLCHFIPLIAQEPPLRVDTCSLFTPLDIAPYVVFTKDNAFKINDLASLSFDLFTKEKAQTLQPDSTYWFRFTLKNNSVTTEFTALLFTDKQSITALFEPDGRVLKSGNHTIFSALSVVAHRAHLLLLIPPMTQKTYFLRLKTLDKKPISVPLQIQSFAYKSQTDKQWRLDYKGNFFFYFFFEFILFAIAVFSLIQGRLLRDKTYAYYAFYLLCIFLYYARQLEINLDYPILCLRFPIMYDLLEVYLNCASYLFYGLFFRQFLDLPTQSLKIDRLLRGILWTIVGTLIINILVQIFGGIEASLWFFDRVRMLFFVFILFYFYVLVVLKGDRLTRLLTFGLIAVILPAIVSVFENITGSVLLDTDWGMIWRSYQLGNFSYGFFDMRVGILIEMTCFSLALYYKTKAERQKNMEIKKRLFALSVEYEALKIQQIQAEKDRLGLAEKEVILTRQISTLKNNVIDNTENTSENDFILRGQKIIESQLSNPKFSVDDFARAMSMSRGKLYTDWKKATGQTPNESIQNARLAEVQRLLLTTDLTISTIAYQTGFNEASYLSQVFFKKFGQPPTDFREK